MFILTGIEVTSEGTLVLIKRINEEVDAMTAEIKDKLPKIYSRELIDLLFYEFYTKIQYSEEVSEKLGMERIYQNKRLFNLVRKDHFHSPLCRQS